MIEVEKRGKLSQNELIGLKSFLSRKGKLLKKLKQLNIFIEFDSPFLGDIGNTKASINISLSNEILKKQTTGRLKVKGGNMQSSSRTEVSIPFDIKDINEIYKFLSVFNINRGCPRFYYREDYEYNGITISIKEQGLAPDHFEAEIEIEDIKDREYAEERINEFTKSLNLQFYTDEEYKSIMLNIFKENPPIDFSDIDLGLVT